MRRGPSAVPARRSVVSRWRMLLGIAGATTMLTMAVPGTAVAQFDPWGRPSPTDPYQTPPQDPYQASPPIENPGLYEAPQGQELVPAPESVPASPPRVENPTAVFSGLDKITGRLTSFDVDVNETYQFGALQVTPRACYTAPPQETPKTDTFVEIDEITLDRDIRRIFTGWMFADSPGLNAVEHPVYDVWLVECRGAPADAAAAGN